jgi:hypothetical protein
VAGVRIPLTQGFYALVDAADAPMVREFTWHLKTKASQPDRLYAQATFRTRSGEKRSIVLHRFIADAAPGQIVDHVSGDTLDCRRKNLRVTSARGNATNVTRSKNQKRGGWKGVSWNKNAGKWEAHIAAGPVKASGKRGKVHLGLYDDPRAAARVYDAAAADLYGEYAALNFP